MRDFLQLVKRDHDELCAGLRVLARSPFAGAEVYAPDGAVEELRGALDGIRLGLSAHAGAEDAVLYSALARRELPPFVRQLIGDTRRAHLEQESVLASLVCVPIGTRAWRQRAHHLLELVTRHARHEEHEVIPALRAHLPAVELAPLAGAFATARLQELANLQPSVAYAEAS